MWSSDQFQLIVFDWLVEMFDETHASLINSYFTKHNSIILVGSI